jgi:hypothetical protein
MDKVSSPLSEGIRPALLWWKELRLKYLKTIKGAMLIESGEGGGNF